MQGCGTRNETFRLGIVLTHDVAHELAHAVAVVVRGAECVLLHSHTRREDHKVTCCNTGRSGLASQYSERAGIQMIERHTVDRVEHSHIVLEGAIVTGPSYNIEWRSLQVCEMKHTQELVEKGEVLRCGKSSLRWKWEALIFVICSRCSEVTRVCKAICTNRAEVGDDEVTIVNLTDVTTCRSTPVRRVELDSELEATWDDTELARGHTHATEFGLDIEWSLLRDNQHVTIGAVEGAVTHGVVAAVDIDSTASLGSRIASTRNRDHALKEVDRFSLGFRDGEGLPTELVGVHFSELSHHASILILQLGYVVYLAERGMGGRGTDLVNPSSAVVNTRRCK